jgi:5-formyltetrahydrofolate cyclo-ligase
VIDERTVVATTVHSLQILEEELPETDHDFRVDLVVTPDEVIETGADRTPGRILWDDLDDERRRLILRLRDLNR